MQRHVQKDLIYTGQLVSLMDVAWRGIWITNIHLMIIAIDEKHILNGNESKSYHLQPKSCGYLLENLMSVSIQYPMRRQERSSSKRTNQIV